ncbi:DUF721 domain-containing protein [Trueperella pecoris]|uniref:DUF721 domain-containing protein n=1 Tax=Trueperella pecoris TaxID=2733571 RepID=UPI0021004033|nr:DciA family protein [Trueperella pecoris]
MNEAIGRAKQEAAKKFGDLLPLECLQRARRMAEAQGWVRVRMAARVELVKEDQIGEEIFVPTPGQDVGSGARPSKRDPKPLDMIFSHLIASRGWKSQLEVGSVAARWPDIVGPAICENCVVEDFSEKGILTLRAKTSAWQTQIRALSAFLDKRLEEELGPGVVKEIVVGGPNTPSWKHGRYSVPGRGPRDTYG